jgi:hypothetical protein
MRRWGHRRYTSRRHCSGGVLAVGALLESAPVLNFHGLGIQTFQDDHERIIAEYYAN